MSKITSVGAMSLGKVMGMSGVLVGAIFGVLYGLIVIMASAFGLGADGGGVAAMGIVGGIAIMVAVPLFYGVASFVFGVLYGWVLNIVLGMAGGLEIELE